MTKKEILDYITETPGNTNRAVLDGMLDSFEGGSGGGTEPLLVNANSESVLDKTWQEIHDAFIGGQNVIIHQSFEGAPEYIDYLVCRVGVFMSNYEVAATGAKYNTDTADGYPRIGED